MTVSELQAYLGVEDDVTIAYGYTFERSSVTVYFCKGKLIRSEWRLDKATTSEECETAWRAFIPGIKRWYLGKPEKGIGYCLHPKLLELFNFFGVDLPTTPGGNY